MMYMMGTGLNIFTLIFLFNFLSNAISSMVNVNESIIILIKNSKDFKTRTSLYFIISLFT